MYRLGAVPGAEPLVFTRQVVAPVIAELDTLALTEAWACTGHQGQQRLGAADMTVSLRTRRLRACRLRACRP